MQCMWLSNPSSSESPVPYYKTAVLRSHCWRRFTLSQSRICSSFYTTLALNTINCKRFIKINPLPQIWMSLGRCVRAWALGRPWGWRWQGQPWGPCVPERMPRRHWGTARQGCSSTHTPALSIYTHMHTPGASYPTQTFTHILCALP